MALWRVQHDCIAGGHPTPIALISGGVVPRISRLTTTFAGKSDDDARPFPEADTRYTILVWIDQPAPLGVNRNIPLFSLNVMPEGKLTDAYPGGHAIRRDGDNTIREDVFISDVNDADDVAASRASAPFPTAVEERLAIQPGTLGYPDVDTYRDLWFVIEGE